MADIQIHVTGDIGAGKTTVIELMKQFFTEQGFNVDPIVRGQDTYFPWQNLDRKRDAIVEKGVTLHFNEIYGQVRFERK